MEVFLYFLLLFYRFVVNKYPPMKAIILAAWKGTRLSPITDTIPKVMVEVAWKSLLEYNMEHLRAYVDEYILVVKYKQEVIRDYFGDEFHGIPVTYHEQWEKTGTGGAIDGIDIEWDCFMVTSDQIFNQKDVDTLAQSKWYGALAKAVANPEKYGIFKLDNEWNMLDIVEKPKEYLGNLASVLYFKVNSEVLRDAKNIEISQRGEYELIMPIQKFARNHKLHIHKLQYPFIDITSVDDLEKANLNILNLEKPKFWESIFLENFSSNYSLHVWIPESVIDTIIQNTADEADIALKVNTWDRKRFSSREKFESWYNGTGRYVFSLLENSGTIAGLWFWRPSDAPEFSKIENISLATTIEQNNTKIHTGWIRLYPNARGKWLATPLITRSSYYYRQLCPDAYMSIDIDEDNIPSQKAYIKAWYQYAWLGENRKTIGKNPKERLIFVELP